MSRRENRSEGRREKGGRRGEKKNISRRVEGRERCPARVSSGPGLLPIYTLTFPSAKTVSRFF